MTNLCKADIFKKQLIFINDHLPSSLLVFVIFLYLFFLIK
jgi:hypothetical protein